MYLGYEEMGEMPNAGFVDYGKLYVTHEMLMMEDRVWGEYKADVMMGLGEEHKGDRV